MPNWYQVLGTSSRADGSQLKSSFRNLAKTLHPDLNSGDKRAEERFKELNQAYEVLRDPGTRAVYDALLANKRSRARQRFWKAAATMSATFVVCVALGSSLVIWLTGERSPLAQVGETVRRSDSDPVALIPRMVTGTDGAAGQEPKLRIATATPVEPNEAVEARVPQASLVGAPTTGKRRVQARWLMHQRKRASYISEAALSVAHIDNVPKEVQPAASRPSPAQLAQGERLLDKGQQSLAQGNIVVARLFFARAAALGLAAAALRLAETHDPNELARFKVHGLKHDPAEARRWYERAIELGAKEAEPKLSRLANR